MQSICPLLTGHHVDRLFWERPWWGQTPSPTPPLDVKKGERCSVTSSTKWHWFNFFLFHLHCVSGVSLPPSGIQRNNDIDLMLKTCSLFWPLTHHHCHIISTVYVLKYTTFTVYCSFYATIKQETWSHRIWSKTTCPPAVRFRQPSSFFSTNLIFLISKQFICLIQLMDIHLIYFVFVATFLT